MSDRSPLTHPLALAWAIVTALVIGVAALRPEIFDQVGIDEEGPVEHVSHVVLLVAVVAWAGASWRLRSATDSRRPVALVVTAYVVLLFGEEIDWGAVYGFMPLSDGLEALIGIPSLHQSTWRPSSLLTDKLAWFGVPAVLWYGLFRVPVTRVRSWTSALGPVAPSSPESLWLFGSLVTYMLLDPFISHGILNPYQLLVYTVIGASGIRAFTHLGASDR